MRSNYTLNYQKLKTYNFILIIVFFCGLQSTRTFAGHATFADSISNSWAKEIIEYIPGNNVFASYTNANVVLGPASKTTDVDGAQEAVTINNPPWQNNQIVSIGTGGRLIIRMGDRVDNYDDPEHPFGIDLLV